MIFDIFQVYFNFAVIKKLRNRPPSQHEEQNQRRKKCLKLILAVTVIFFILWLPLTIFTLISEYNPQSLKDLMGRYHDVAYGLLHLLGAGTSIANPILYGYMNENFRNEYRKFYHRMPWYSSKILTRRWRSTRGPVLNSSSSSLESGQVVCKPPKRLRNLKDIQLNMTQLESHNSHTDIVVHATMNHENCDICHAKCDRTTSIESNYGSLECESVTSEPKVTIENETWKRSKSLKETIKETKPKVRKTISLNNGITTILPEQNMLPILEKGTPKSVSFRIIKPSKPIKQTLSDFEAHLKKTISMYPLVTKNVRFLNENTQETAL